MRDYVRLVSLSFRSSQLRMNCLCQYDGFRRSFRVYCEVVCGQGGGPAQVYYHYVFCDAVEYEMLRCQYELKCHI